MNQCTTSSTLEDTKDLNYCPNHQCGNRKKVGICSESSLSSDMLTKYAWANKYQCGQCKHVWYLCQLCSRQSNRMENETELYNHNYLYHGENFQIKDSSSNTSISSKKKKRKFDVETSSKKTIPMKEYVVGKKSVHKEITLAEKKSIHDDIACFVECSSSVGEMSSITNNFRDNITMKKKKCRKEIKETNYDRLQSYKYFKENESHDFPAGPSYLIGLSLFESKFAYNHLAQNDVDLHLLIAKFVTSLSTIQRKYFAKIMDLSLNSPSPNDIIPMFPSAHQTKTLTVRLPESYAEIRNKYIEGVNSFESNLPYPKIHKIRKHTYVTVRQCIADFLSHGYNPKHIPSQSPEIITSIAQSKRAQQILFNSKKNKHFNNTYDVIPLMAFTWSDGFQPQSSKVAQGSCWVKTISFLSDDECDGSLYNTYLLSLGKSGDDHEEIEIHFSRELNELKEGINNIFYSSFHSKRIRVHFEIVAVLADQPERRSLCCWKMGNGKNTARWKYAFDVKRVHQYLPLCCKCFKLFMKDPHGFDFMSSCQNCSKWDFDTSSTMSVNTPIPKNTPLDLSLKCTPKKITFKLLKDIVSTSHHKIISGDWDSKAATSVLDSFGINDATITKIVENSEREYSYQYLKKTSTNKAGLNSLIHLKNHQPSLFEEWTGCSIWRSPIEIHNVIDVIMHLLFLGVVKEQRNLIKEWMSATRRIKAFNIFVKNVNILHSVEKMNLSWCKIISTESGTSAGWISENYLGFCRVMKWYYHSVTSSKQEKPYVDPTSHPDTWLKDQCVQFLKARDIDSTGRRDDLREKIKILMSEKDGPPPIMIVSGCNMIDFHHCISSLLAMVSIAMTKKVKKNTAKELDHHVKAYLSFLHVFQFSIRKQSPLKKKKKSSPVVEEENKPPKIPCWLQHFNFLSLLNLPETMSLYGPLVNTWEGGNRGEGYLRHLKPMITNTVRPNWNHLAHENIMKEKSKSQILHDHFKNYSKEKQLDFQMIFTQNQSFDFVIYNDLCQLINEWCGNKPLSCVLLKNGNICAVTKKTRENFVSVKVDTKFHHEIKSLAMCFFQLHIDTTSDESNMLYFTKGDIENYLLLLPKLAVDGFVQKPNQNKYYIITDEWMEMNKYSMFTKYKMK